MADNPGKRPHDGDDESRNPFEELLRQLGMSGNGDLSSLLSHLQGQVSQAFGQMQRMFGDETGNVLDRAVVASTAQRVLDGVGSEFRPSDEQSHDLRVAVELADSWLADATTFPSGTPTLGACWTRKTWVEKSMPMWVRLTEPVVTHLADALEDLTKHQHDEAMDAFPGMAELAGHLRPMVRKAAGGMFGAQMGEALGQIALEVLSATDLGLPIPDETTPALLPTNVAAFVKDIGGDSREVQLYLALREVARQRLFASVSWLEPQLIALVEHYAREIRIDPTALERAFEEATQVSPDQVAVTLDGSVFEPDLSTEQEETLERLEILLALVEGWVDDVVAVAAKPWLPSAPALAEAVRRRRATGGPTRKALQALVGLEMSPRRVRDAATLWAAVRDARGVAGRDEVWSHPEDMPTAHDLDDPIGFVHGDRADAATDAMNEELRKLLDGETGSEPGGPA